MASEVGSFNVLVMCGASSRDPITSIDPTFEVLLEEHQEIRVLGVDDLTPDTKLDGIMTIAHSPVDGALVDSIDASSLKIISNYGSGVDHINLQDMKDRGIPVANLRVCPALTHATADCAFALLLAAARRIVENDAYARSPAFTTYDNLLLLGNSVHGSTLGIVGMGTIGVEVARRAAGFRMRILYHNRSRRPENEEAELGATYCEFEELLGQADHVVLLLSGNDLLMDADAFKLMKPGSSLINMARGGIVCNLALAEALASGRICSAALDITDPEPLPTDHPLREQPRCTILPHRGSATKVARDTMCKMTFDHLLMGLRGKASKIESLVTWI